MRQIVDLEGSPEFRALETTIVSIATDSIDELKAAMQEFRTTSPLLSDAGGEVSRRYDVLQWATPGGEPGHTFVLVGKDGKVKWIRDYGAPQNGGLMYVKVDELVGELAQRSDKER